MEWSKVLPAAIAFLAAFLMPLIFSKRSKEGEKKKNNTSQNLLSLGIDFEKIEKGDERIEFVKKLSWGQKAEGIFKIENRNIDFIFLISESNQYGVNFSLDYIIQNSFNVREEPVRNTRMKLIKDSLMGRKSVGVLWKGDTYLSQKLNMDYALKDKLKNTGLKELKLKLRIIPEKKHGYTRIKTDFISPSQDLISFIDSVAGHIKEGF
jgi:hypothetical protein